MKNLFNAILMLVLVCVVTSCGHEGLFYGEGTTFTANTTGLTYIKGKGLWDFSRENTSLVIESATGDGLASIGESAFKGHFVVKKTIGKQILGYTVDLAKQSPEAVTEWLKGAEAPKTEEGSLLPTPDANSKYVAPEKKEEPNNDAPAN